MAIMWDEYTVFIKIIWPKFTSTKTKNLGTFYECMLKQSKKYLTLKQRWTKLTELAFLSVNRDVPTSKNEEIICTDKNKQKNYLKDTKLS